MTLKTLINHFRLQNACGIYLGSRSSWSAASSKNHLDPASANTDFECTSIVSCHAFQNASHLELNASLLRQVMLFKMPAI
jgi:hypothetical protein